MRQCTDEELGLGPQGYEDPRSKFYPVASGGGWLKNYSRKLNCIDQKIESMGTYNSDSAQKLQIGVVRCDPTVRQCKSEAEIDLWLKRKFIIVVTNNERFNPVVFTDERVVKESVFTWFPV